MKTLKVHSLIVGLWLILTSGGCESLSFQKSPVAVNADQPPPSESSNSNTQNSLETQNAIPSTYPIIGAVEYVRLKELPFILEARIDTGATTSSIDARDIKPFERDTDDWVRFAVPHRETGKLHPLELPVVRIAQIEQTGQDERRPVVELTVALGDGEFVTREFTLTSREGYDYPVLVGRNILEGNYLVDPAQIHLLERL